MNADGENTRRVGEVFDAAAGRYDLMNDLMSFGTHRLLKRALVDMTRLRPGQRALDLAGGTGDVAALLSPVVGASGRVVLADINAAMLGAGRDRLLDRGLVNVACVRADGCSLAFADASFDAVTIAFGLRNFSDRPAGLGEMRRVLRPGGVAVVLEFATVEHPALAAAWSAFRSTWPLLGRAVAGAEAPYRYLVESIDRYPDQATMKGMMQSAGFADVECHDVFGGVAAFHRGVRRSGGAA